jgi:hypothetical protein
MRMAVLQVGYRGYIECARDVTWAFGTGLSYTSFGAFIAKQQTYHDMC